MTTDTLNASRLAGSPASNPVTPREAWADLWLIAAVTAATFVVGSAFELSEAVARLFHHFEAYQIDELPVTLAAMLAGLTWYSWRRHRHAGRELSLRLTAQAQLERSLAENRLLVQRNIQVQEDERRNIARELHDEMGQWLNALKLDAVAIRDTAAADPQIRIAAQSVIDVADHVYDVVRQLMRRLRPVALDELGLQAALQYLLDQWKARHNGIECRFQAGAALDDLGEAANITIYRFVQECLTNITKHADARQVTIALHRDAGTARLTVSVQDDGRGIGAASTPFGMGLAGLRERVDVLGGEFRVEACAPSGTRVSASLPA